MTSKVTVGADITREWDHVFIHLSRWGNSQHCTPARELLQMGGRFRNLRNTTIHAFHQRSELVLANDAEKRAAECEHALLAKVTVSAGFMAGVMMGSKKALVNTADGDYIFQLHVDRAI
jgi:hypothetical protein